jgi:salicylate hydroxylase
MVPNNRQSLTLQGGWASGCVTLVGDAAHALLPTLGQGAGQAIETAVELAVVRLGQHAEAGRNLFDGYLF